MRARRRAASASACPEEYFAEGLDPEVEASVRAAIARSRRDGCVVRPVKLPHTRYAVATYYVVATAEASTNLARFDGVRYGLRVEPEHGRSARACTARRATRASAREVKRRILLGTYVLSRGLLRRVLPAGAAGAHADPPRLRRRRSRGRRDRHPDEPDAGVPPRREDRRPARDVPRRRLHAARRASPASPASACRAARRARRATAPRCPSDFSSCHRPSPRKPCSRWRPESNGSLQRDRRLESFGLRVSRALGSARRSAVRALRARRKRLLLRVVAFRRRQERVARAPSPGSRAEPSKARRARRRPRRSLAWSRSPAKATPWAG